MIKLSVRVVEILFVTALFSFSQNLFALTAKDELNECKKRLKINKLPPAGSCNGPNTVAFSSTLSPTQFKNSRLGYFKINDDVDAVFHCGDIDNAPEIIVGVMEVIIHKRSTGETCFFDRKTTNSQNFPSMDPGDNPNVNNYWVGGGSRRDCESCHTNGGPYFMGNSAEGMALFGLINNGHDTMGERYNIVELDPALEEIFNETVSDRVGQNVTCGNSCHKFGTEFRSHRDEQFVIPMKNLGMMPPSGDSPFRWINRDTPNATGDHESLSGAQTEYPGLVCSNPAEIEAHVVGSNLIFGRDQTGWVSGVPPHYRFSTKLSTFNLREGLVCLNADQPAGSSCPDFQTSYLCNGIWTAWQDNDRPTNGRGDFETFEKFAASSNYSTICPTPPTAMRAELVDWDSQGHQIHLTFLGYAPNDKLSTFDPQKGLVCMNADQGANNSCSNYVVRFKCQ